MPCFPGLQQLLTLLTGIRDQLVQLNESNKEVRAQVVIMQGQQAETLAQINAWYNDSSDYEYRMDQQMANVELRQSRTWPSQGDAMRHVSQEASGDLWGSSPECLRMVARTLQQGIYSRGQFPVVADKMRGQFYACQNVLQQHNLLASDPCWADGTVACCMPQMQDKICQESGGQLTPVMIDNHIGVTSAIRLQINQACNQAPPRSHIEPFNPIPQQDPDYLAQLTTMLPRHKIHPMTGFRPR